MAYDKAVILEKEDSKVPNGIKQKLYEAFAAADNQDVALEEWPDIVERVLIQHAFEEVTVPLDPPGKVVADAQKLVTNAADCIKKFQSFVNIMGDGPDESDQNMAVRYLIEARALAKNILPVLDQVRNKELFAERLNKAGALYPEGWLHSVVHVNPKTGEVECEDEYPVRHFLLERMLGKKVGSITILPDDYGPGQLPQFQVALSEGAAELLIGTHDLYVGLRTNKTLQDARVLNAERPNVCAEDCQTNGSM